MENIPFDSFACWTHKYKKIRVGRETLCQYFISVKGQGILKIQLRQFMFHHGKKRIKWMGKIRKVERKGFPFCCQREGNFDWTGHLSWTLSLVSPYHVTGWFSLSARSLERWCQQGLELLGRGGKSVLAPPSGLGNLPALRPKADGGLQLCFVVLFQMLVIPSAVSPCFPFPSFSLSLFPSFLHFFQLCSDV